MTSLPEIPDRAAAFLRALPGDLPEPSSASFAKSDPLNNAGKYTEIIFRWQRTDLGPLAFAVVQADGRIRYGKRFTKYDMTRHADFDGAAVPPAIVAAIRRVMRD